MAAIEIIRAEGDPELIEVARQLFAEYALGLDVDLLFQNFATEITTLPGLYSAPAGRILLGRYGGRSSARSRFAPSSRWSLR
jgi:putative acetyltransferase